MVKLLVIADDFTGALDTGVQFAASGAETRVVTNIEYDFSRTGREVQVLVLVAETRVIFAFFCSSGMVRAPQLHMVDFTLLRVRLTLSFKLPAYAT